MTICSPTPRCIPVSASGVFAASLIPPRISQPCVAIVKLSRQIESSDRHSTSSTAIAVVKTRSTTFGQWVNGKLSSCMTAQSCSASVVVTYIHGALPQSSKTLPKLWTRVPTLLPTGQSLAARIAEGACSLQRFPLLSAPSQEHDAGQTRQILSTLARYE